MVTYADKLLCNALDTYVANLAWFEAQAPTMGQKRPNPVLLLLMCLQGALTNWY